MRASQSVGMRKGRSTLHRRRGNLMPTMHGRRWRSAASIHPAAATDMSRWRRRSPNTNTSTRNAHGCTRCLQHPCSIRERSPRGYRDDACGRMWVTCTDRDNRPAPDVRLIRSGCRTPQRHRTQLAQLVHSMGQLALQTRPTLLRSSRGTSGRPLQRLSRAGRWNGHRA